MPTYILTNFIGNKTIPLKFNRNKNNTRYNAKEEKQTKNRRAWKKTRMTFHSLIASASIAAFSNLIVIVFVIPQLFAMVSCICFPQKY